MKKILILITVCLIVGLVVFLFLKNDDNDEEVLLTCNMIDGGTTTEYVFTFNHSGEELISFVRTEIANVVNDAAAEFNYEYFQTLCEEENKIDGVSCKVTKEGNTLTRETSVKYTNMENQGAVPFIHGLKLLESLNELKEGMTERYFTCN